jgi:hypothetical protein
MIRRLIPLLTQVDRGGSVEQGGSSIKQIVSVGIDLGKTGMLRNSQAVRAYPDHTLSGSSAD